MKEERGMKRGWVVTTVLIGLLIWAFSAYPANADASTDARRVACAAPRGVLPPPMYVKGARAYPAQRRNITTALNIARKMRAPKNHRVGLVAAIIAENSGWNKPWGHGTSVGILQLIDIHGPVVWRMKIRNSVGWFLRGARQVDQRGRLDPATLAGRVQRPAGGRSVYVPHIPEAQRIVAKYDHGC